MVGLSRAIGLATLTVGALFWRFRRRAKLQNQIKREKQGNNSQPITTPDETGAEVSLVKNTQELELYVRNWPSNGDLASRGVVLFVHSYSEHSQYFTEFAKVLNDCEFHVVAFDLQSHGLSGTATGRKGDIFRFQDLVSDLESVLKYAKQQFSELPVFIIGEGFGASIALLFCSTHDREVEGLILCSPMVKTTADGLPPLHINPFLKTVEKLTPELRMRTSERFKVDDEVFDPNMNHKLTLRFLVQVNKCLAQLEGNLHKINVPFLTVHGALDTRVPSSHSIELFQKASSKVKEFKIYNEMDSRLLQLPIENHAKVVEDIITWLKKYAVHMSLQKLEILTSHPIRTDFSSTDPIEIEVSDQALAEVARSVKDEPRFEVPRTKQQNVYSRLELNGY